MFFKSLGLICFLVAAFLYVAHGTTIDKRKACGRGDAQPNNRVDTTARLSTFRQAMRTIATPSNPLGKRLKAFIVGSADAHNSEYPSEYDKRRSYISGFGGSAGTAVITETKAALWTDGRYFLEADDVMDCNWILMRSGLQGTPSIEDWLNSEMTLAGDFVGVDKTLVTYTSFERMRDKMSKLSNRPELKAIDKRDNPVDTIWNAGRPLQPTKPINALKLEFAGKTWQEKISDLRREMKKKQAVAFVVTSLDETAWLFNLRGSDIPYNPFFLSYAIVEPTRTRLYILEKYTRLVAQPTDEASNKTLAEHLVTSKDGTCFGGTECVEVINYNQGQIETDLTTLSRSGKVWIPNTQASYAIYSAVQENNRLLENSPIAIWKSTKNDVERVGMQSSSNRDSVALIKFLAFMEKEIADGNRWTEMSAAAEVNKRREATEYNRGESFASISSYGSNGAIIHYLPSPETDKVISDDSLYLLDSGGQYLDGTTDVTRTMHYGKPTEYQKECYTRVLASAVNLASLHWPAGIYGRQLDGFARYQLWDAGLVYRHGTGHGVGAYLSVHEGPGFIGLTMRNVPTDYPLTANQIFSDEPGYYEDNSFGIRLETLVMVTPYETKYKTAGTNFLRFKPITLVPFETKMMNTDMLTRRQVEWLNDYNDRIRSDILPLLNDDQLAVDWVKARTGHIDAFNGNQGAGTVHPTAVFLVSTVFTIVIAFRNRL